jgi:hypothetical protein
VISSSAIPEMETATLPEITFSAISDSGDAEIGAGSSSAKAGIYAA